MAMKTSADGVGTHDVASSIGAHGAEETLCSLCREVGLLDLAFMAVHVRQIYKKVSNIIPAPSPQRDSPMTEPEWHDYKMLGQRGTDCINTEHTSKIAVSRHPCGRGFTRRSCSSYNRCQRYIGIDTTSLENLHRR